MSDVNTDTIIEGSAEWEALSPQQRGAITRRRKQQERDMAEQAQVEQGKPQDQTVTLTMAQLQEMSRNIANEVREQVRAEMRSERAESAPRRNVMKNSDFMANSAPVSYQTQEEVVRIAMTAGPVTRGRNFVPAPPEHVAARDWNEHKDLIATVESFGYRVALDRVEFQTFWEPADEEGVLIPKHSRPAEPEAAQPYIEQLKAVDARHSRIWLQAWFDNRTLTGERQIDEAAAKDAVGQRAVASVAAGDMSAIDNVSELSVM